MYNARLARKRTITRSKEGWMQYRLELPVDGMAIFCFCLVSMVSTEVQAFEMEAGVAKAAITNDTPLVMVNGNVSEGALKDIHARVLVLNDGDGRLVFVTYDLNCLDVATPLLRVRVRDELGIPPERLILLATHNHSAPIQIVPDNFDYGHKLADTIFGLIQEAIAKESGPVRVLFGTGKGEFVLNRGNAPTDDEIQMLKIVGGERPLAVLFTHATHPVQASGKKVGAGHPGYAMDEIENALPGVQAMYADSCGGDQFVDRPKEIIGRLSDARKDGEAEVDKILEAFARDIGHQLAVAALDIAAGDMVDVTGPLTSRMDLVSLPLDAPVSRKEAKRLAKRIPKDIGFVPYPHEDRGTNWIRMLLYWYENDIPFPASTSDLVCTDDSYMVHKDDENHLKKYDDRLHDEFPCEYEEVIVARIGDMPFLAMQGEVCSPIGTRIKERFRPDGPIFVTAYMGEHNLYIPSRELVRLKAYQSRVIQIQYASPVGWSPDVEDVMVDSVIKLVESPRERKSE